MKHSNFYIIFVAGWVTAAFVAAGRDDLPAQGSKGYPVVVLEAEPLRELAPQTNTQQVVLGGTVTLKEGADFVTVGAKEVSLARKGFGKSRIAFRYQLAGRVSAADYVFWARWQQGGDPNVCGQTFEIWAGRDVATLELRGKFSLKPGGFKYRWVAGQSLTLRTDDTVLEVRNSGNAHDAKMFDTFLLVPDPLFLALAAMPPESAAVRGPFLHSLKSAAKPRSRWFLLDGGQPAEGDALFRGLSTKAAQKLLTAADITYRAGREADELGARLNLPGTPALVATDERFTMLGALVRPRDEQAVEAFLRAPAQAGPLPSPAAQPGPEATPLTNGVPAAWLVSGIHDGAAGVTVFGIDAEQALRPNPGQPFPEVLMMGGSMAAWTARATTPAGVCLITPATKHSYGWARGTGYAYLYVQAERAATVMLHTLQSGVQTLCWLDGQAVALETDPAVPSGFPPRAASGAATKTGLTTEGLIVTAVAEKAELPRVAKLALTTGWHRLLLKFIMQHETAEPFFFAAQFGPEAGHALDGLRTQLVDPQADLALHAHAAQLHPRFHVSVPGHLPRPGEALVVQADVSWTKLGIEPRLGAPVLPFAAKLRVRLTDYDGHELAIRETAGHFPGVVSLDFGPAPAAGYYALQPSLHTADGRLIMVYPPDGFSVVRGAAAQRERLDRKKLWNNYYYISEIWPDLFNWLERSGVWRNLGSYPGWGTRREPMWKAAQERGMVLFGDFIGDSHEVNLKPADIEQTAQALAPYTRWFKGFNEIDIHMTMPQRAPKTWVERTRWEFDAVKKARPESTYLGGSLVRPGAGEAPGKWFIECLKLGVDRYHDAWDVHCYPKFPPVLEGPLGDAGFEGDRGVRRAYEQVGRTNALPFWIGETGAKAAHGLDGRRWQADMVAKLIALANSRADVHGIAFCIAHEYWWDSGRLWDYSMGHQPGEAALYTASALIDGLPYTRVKAGDPAIQAARFGETLMAWTTGRPTVWQTTLTGNGPWLVVDVVGCARPLAVDGDGRTQLALTSRPLYILSKANYARLTGGQK